MVSVHRRKCKIGAVQSHELFPMVVPGIVRDYTQLFKLPSLARAEPTAEATHANINLLPLWDQASSIGPLIAGSVSNFVAGGRKRGSRNVSSRMS